MWKSNNSAASASIHSILNRSRPPSSRAASLRGRPRPKLNSAQKASFEAELEVTNAKADACTEDGNSGDAVKCREVAVDLVVQVYGEDSEEMVEALYELGMAYYDDFHLEHAGRCLKQALSLFSALRMQDVEVLGNIYVGLGNCLMQREQWNPALTMYARCAEILEQSFGKRYQGLVSIYTNMGLVHFNLGQLDKALDLFTTALRISETILGIDKLECADVLHNIGAVYHKQGNLITALRVYHKAADIRTRQLGEDSLVTCVTLSNLAQIYEEQEKWGKAFELLSHIRRVRETKLETGDPVLSDTYLHLGIVYAAVGRRADAVKMLQRARLMRKHVYGDDDVRTREVALVTQQVLTG